MISGCVKPYDDAPRARGGSGVSLALVAKLETNKKTLLGA